jgi:hypothetical protein
MSSRAQKLKDLIDTMLYYIRTKFKRFWIDKIQQKVNKMNRYISHVQRFEDRYEKSANRAIHIKRGRIPYENDSPTLSQYQPLPLSEEFDIKYLNQLLIGITITIGKRKAEMSKSLKLMSTPVKHTSISLPTVGHVCRLSVVNSDRVWVYGYIDSFSKNYDDGYNLISIDNEGTILHFLGHVQNLNKGIHTVNSSGELIYIDKNECITKLSLENNTLDTLVEPASPWVPHCLYCSPVTGDLLVGLCNIRAYTGKVTRYSSTYQHILTIQHDNDGDILYNYPGYITENKNGDIAVCELYHVVVTDSRGKHRFTYTGPPSGLAP